MSGQLLLIPIVEQEAVNLDLRHGSAANAVYPYGTM